MSFAYCSRSEKAIEPFHTSYVTPEFGDITPEDAQAAGQLFLRACEQTFIDERDALQPITLQNAYANVGVRSTIGDKESIIGAYTFKLSGDATSDAPFIRQLVSMTRNDLHTPGPPRLMRLYNVTYFYDESSGMLTKCATARVRGRYAPILEQFAQSTDPEAVHLAQALRKTAPEEPQPFGILKDYRRCTAVGTLECNELQTVFAAIRHQTWPQ